MSEFDFNKNNLTPDDNNSAFDFDAQNKADVTGQSSPADAVSFTNNENDSSSVFTSAADSIERSVNTEAAKAPSAEASEYTYAYKGEKLYSDDYTRSQRKAEGPSEAYTSRPYTPPSYQAPNPSQFQRQEAPAYNHANQGYASQQNTNAGFSAPNGAPNPYAQQNQGAQRPPFTSPMQNQGPGANTNGYGYTNARPEPPRPPEAPKKRKGSLKTSTAILLCVACVLLSFASGILGSAIISKMNGASLGDYQLSEGDIENGSVAGVTEDGAVVLYRSVETVTEDGGDMSIAEVADLVSDSVVEITTEFVTSNNYFFGQYVSEGAGSGVIISEDGYVITNNHVISDSSTGATANKITVRLRSGEEYEAKVVGKDSDSDVAILKISAEDLKAAVWGDSDKLVVGQQVIAVGNPLGELGGTVTTGIISASDREVQIDNVVMTLIQIDAAVNPGNSGGGLFNTKGELIGIVNAKSSGSGIEGLGFAIPSNEASDITEQLLQHGYVKGKVYLGLSFYEANSGYYSASGSDSSILYIYATEEGYNDDVLQSKDIVLSIDGKEVSTTAEVKAILKNHKVGDKLTFSILRGKEPMEVEVTCYEATPSDDKVHFED